MSAKENPLTTKAQAMNLIFTNESLIDQEKSIDNSQLPVESSVEEDSSRLMILQKVDNSRNFVLSN